MPKLHGVRWPVAILLALLLIGAISFASAALRPASLTGGLAAALGLGEGDEFAGERRQLLFFEAALRRIDDELRRRDKAATPSLGAEREAVLGRMREVAVRVPPARVPPQVAALMLSAGPPSPAGAGEAQPRPAIAELQTGLGARAAAVDVTSLALDPPPPLPVFVEHPSRRAERARDDGDKPARERSTKETREAKDKERRGVEKAAKDRAPADRGDAERAPDHAAAARTAVERTAAADQSERRQAPR